jgi:very-short-patch-repair endonuclease
MTDFNNFHDYNPHLKSFAREHRNNSTKAEIRMWTELLRAKKMQGYAFLRQRPILNYIADFYCKDLKLIIEVDGFTHDDSIQAEKDNVRTRDLNQNGYHIMRFTDYEVMNELPQVKDRIEKWIEEWEQR